MPGLDSDFKEALHYAIRNCPARTTGQQVAIDHAERALRHGLVALSPLERKTLALELGFWLDHYQRLQEFSGQRLASTDVAPRRSLSSPINSKTG